MAVTTCPHCKADVPPGFDAMPVCMICGGDLHSAPVGGSGWAALDTKQDNTRICPSCNAEVKSVFALECPECNAALAPVGEPVDDIEKERERFEELIKQAHTPDPVAPPAPEPVAAAPEPIAPPPPPQPVAPPPPPVSVPKAPEPVAASRPSPELPNFVDKPVEKPTSEPTPVSRQPEPKPAAPANEGFFSKLLRMLGLKK